MKRQIPNILTLLNLLSGVVIIILSFQFEFEKIGFVAIAALLFDFMDGTAARALKVTSGMGKELDSLADMVSFGVAPGLVLYNFIQQQVILNDTIGDWSDTQMAIASLIPLLIPALAAYRLARFNVTEQSSNYFKGLPTPALAFGSFAIPLAADQAEWVLNIAGHPLFIVGFTVIGSLLLISNVKLISLKLGSTDRKLNLLRIILLIAGLILIISMKFFGVILCLLLYLVLSLTTQKHLT